MHEVDDRGPNIQEDGAGDGSEEGEEDSNPALLNRFLGRGGDAERRTAKEGGCQKMRGRAGDETGEGIPDRCFAVAIVDGQVQMNTFVFGCAGTI